MPTQFLRGAAAVVFGLAAGLGIALGWSASESTPPALGGVESSADDSKPGARPPPLQGIDMEAQRELELSLWSAKLAEHEAQAVDEGWSSQASRSFQAELTRLGEERGFLLVRTECKTTSCAATLRWPSFDAAVDGFAALLHAGYELGCARRTTLPEPDDPEQPYDSTLLFECSGAHTLDAEPGTGEALE